MIIPFLNGSPQSQSPYTDALLSFLAENSLEGCLVLSLGLFLVALLHRESSRVRRWVLSSVLVGLIGLPVFGLFLPSWQVPVVGLVTQTAPRPDAAIEAKSENGRILSTVSANEPATTELDLGHIFSGQNWQADQTAAKPAPVGTILLATAWLATMNVAQSVMIMTWTALRTDQAQNLLLSLIGPLWLSGVLVLFLRFALATLGLRRIERRSTPLLDRAWLHDIARFKHELHIDRDVELLIVAGRPTWELGPCTFGHFHPTILLPASATGWSDERREVVLLHELSHISRHDWILRRLARVACHFHWFNPLAWLALKRLTLEQERTCDETVLSTGVPASHYARHLLELAQGLTRSAPATTLSMTPPSKNNSKLEARLMRILDKKPRRRFSLALPAAVASVVLVPLVAAMELQLPEPAKPPRVVELPDVGEFGSEAFAIAPVVAVVPRPEVHIRAELTPPIAPLAPVGAARAVPGLIGPAARAVPGVIAPVVAPDPLPPVLVTPKVAWVRPTHPSRLGQRAFLSTPRSREETYARQRRRATEDGDEWEIVYEDEGEWEEGEWATVYEEDEDNGISGEKRHQLEVRLEALQFQQDQLVEQLETTLEQTFGNGQLEVDTAALEEIARQIEGKVEEFERRNHELFGPNERAMEELQERIEARSSEIEERVERKAEEMARLAEEQSRLWELESPASEAHLEGIRRRAQILRQELSDQTLVRNDEFEQELREMSEVMRERSAEVRARSEALRREIEPLEREMRRSQRELGRRHREASQGHETQTRGIHEQLRTIHREMSKIHQKLRHRLHRSERDARHEGRPRHRELE